MSYVCKECYNWINSEYPPDRDGWRWCSYSKRYEKPDQNIYRCPAFIYVRRFVLTKICSILGLPVKEYFEAYDDVNDTFVTEKHPEWIIRYCEIGPKIVQFLDEDPCKEQIARNMLEHYIQPAYTHWQSKDYGGAAELFRDMIRHLEQHYA